MIRCERCEQKLNESRAVWLELNTNTGNYHREGDFPAEGLSQGSFSFGAACADRQLTETRRATTPAPKVTI